MLDFEMPIRERSAWYLHNEGGRLSGATGPLLKVLRSLGERVSESLDDPKQVITVADLKVAEGWEADIPAPFDYRK
jgi:hypothetical protein